MDEKTVRILKSGFGLAMILLGMLLNNLGVGLNYFVGFQSVGTYLVYIGFLSLIVVNAAGLWRKRKVVDERMAFVANKAMRSTFLAFVLAAFVLMVVDGITPISVPYHLFLSYLVCGLLLFYYLSYRVLLRFH